MRESLIRDGLVYCDWRVSNFDCVDQNFFRTINYVNGYIGVVSLFFATCLLIYRFAIRKDPPSLTNLTLCTWCVMQIFFASSYFLSNLSKIYIANEIIWSITYPFGIFTFTLYLSALLQATPRLGQKGGLLPPDSLRKAGVITISLILFTTQIIIFGFIGYYDSQDNQRVLISLFRAGMGLMAFNFLLVLILVSFYGSRFTSLIDQVIKETERTKVDVDSLEHVSLKLAITKVKKILKLINILCIYYLLVTILFGFYDDFFVNIRLSKAFAVINCMWTCFDIPLIAMLIIVDLIKIYEKEKYSSRDTSKKEEKERKSLSMSMSMSMSKEMEHPQEFIKNLSGHD